VRPTKKEIKTSPNKPPLCKVNLRAIPEELQKLPRWVFWKWTRKNGEWTKVPYTPGIERRARPNDPSTWGTWDQIVNKPPDQGKEFDGIGYFFHEDDGYTGTDLDDAIDPETGELKPWAQEKVDKLSSYTETSPTQTGVKIVARGRKPSDKRCKTKYADGEVEMYHKARFFCLTGQRWPGTPEGVEERTQQIAEVYNEVFAKPEKEKARAPQSETPTLADDELLDKARAAKNGDKFARLYDGDTSDYGDDDSSADQALCNMLAFWTDKDAARMVRLFRGSGLMREKWDERRGEKTYGQKTIEEACAFVQETYRGARRRMRVGTPPPNGDGIHNGDDGRRPGRPEIVLGTDEWRVNNEAIKALSDAQAAPEVYQRGNLLVRVLRAAKAGKQSRIDRPEGTPRITLIPAPHLSELLARVADFMKPVPKKNGDFELVPAHPSERCIAAVLARGHYPDVRGLEAVVEAPTLRPDCTVLDARGWDEETGLLYEPNADFPPVPPTPGRGQAMAAATRILDLVSDFPFAGRTPAEQDNHRAAWLAGVLTALVRFAVHGPCPLFLFDANCPGTGKSLLTDVIAIIATGRDMSRTPFPDNDAELQKQITAIALAGDRLMLFDNIAQGCPFGGTALDTALTAATWKDRILGRSELTPELPLFTVFYATGNNFMLRGDVQRRVIPCRLETQEEKPEEREGFKYPELVEHVRANRPQLVCDCLTIMRAFAVAGRPQADLPAFGSYESWSRLVRQAVFWVMGADPWATREKIRATDPVLNTLAALLEGWAELPGGRCGVTVAEALRFLNDPNRQDDFATLRGALMEWSHNDRLPGAGTVGHKLRSFKRRVVEGRMMDAEPCHGGVQRWKVLQAR
jgi:hypothetical protein